MSFDSVETALKVRDIIARQAKRTIDVTIPKPLIGRVITMDLPNKRAMVWIPGDDQPIPVKLFSSTIPAAWQSQFASVNTAYNSYQGFGSNVVIQTFNGQKYITDVLSGGQFAFDLHAMNLSIVSTEANVTNSFGIYGQPYESFANFHVFVGASRGQALLLGPFTKGDFDSAGWMEVTWQGGETTKSWKFSVATYQDFQGSGTTPFNRWYRIVPSSQICNNTVGTEVDADLDIALRQTSYGIDPQYQAQQDELWIRLVKADDESSISGTITIRTSLAQKFRALDGSELLIQQLDTSPAAIQGYMGFHNSQGPAKDFTNTLYKESFKTVLTDTWGSTSEMIPFQWSLVGGGSSNYDVVTAGFGRITMTAVSTNYHTIITKTPSLSQDLGGKDCDAFFTLRAPNAAATGGSIFAGAALGYTSSNEHAYARFEFTTTGTINVAIVRRTGGVDTVVNNNTSTGLTWTAGQLFRCHAMVAESDALNSSGTSNIKIECVPITQSFVRTWLIDSTYSSYPAAARGFAFRADRAAGNTNTNPYVEFGALELYMEVTPTISSRRIHTGPWRSGELRMGELLQKTWSVDGRLVFDLSSGRVRWYDEITFSGIGVSRLGLAGGFATLTCPAYQTIPVYSGNGITSVTASALGIPLGRMEALWCGIPPGTLNRNLQGELFITSHYDIGGQFHVPEWAVLIAYRDESDIVRWGNGQFTSDTAESRMMAEYEAAMSSSLNPVPAATTDVTGATVTFTVSRQNSYAFCVGTFDFNNLTASTAVAIGVLNAAGSEQSAQALHTAAVIGGRATVMQSWTVRNLFPGTSYTFKLQARCPGSSTAHALNSQHTKLNIQVFE